MFGRKKKKSDLDWRPDGEPVVADIAFSSAEDGKKAGKKARKASAKVEPTVTPHASFSPSIQTGAASSDVWSGLVHPRAVLRFLRQQFVLITLVAILVVGAGLTAFNMLPSKFSSTALVLVDPRQPRITDSDTVVSGIGGDAAALTSYVQIMKSGGFLSNVVDELGVKDDPDYAGAQNQTALVGMFQKNISANRQGATYIVEVNAISGDKENAAKYANGVAAAFVRDQKDYRSNANEEAAQWLSERLQLLHGNLRKSEEAVAAFRAKNGIVDAGSQGTLDNQQLTSLISQIGAVTTELADSKARYDQARKDGVPGSARATQSGEFTNLDQLMQEQDRLRRDAAELNQTLGSRHPRILANREQQSIIAGQIARERSRLVERAKQDYETTLAKKQALEGQLADLRQRSIQLNQAKVELDNLEREATANRNLYEQFLARYKITDEQAQFNFNEARIVSRGVVPLKSTKPSIKLVGAALVILGFVLGLLVALIRVAFAAPERPRESDFGGFARGPNGPLSPTPVGVSAHFASNYRFAGMAYAPGSYPAPADSAATFASTPFSFAPTGPAATAAPVVAAAVANKPNAGIVDEVEGQQEAAASGTSEPQSGVGRAMRRNLPEAEADTQDVAELLPDADPDTTSTEETSGEDAQPGATVANTSGQPSGGPADPVIIRLPNTPTDGGRPPSSPPETNMWFKALDGFLKDGLAKENLSLLVTAAQPGDGLNATADLVRSFAVESGFHPVVISLHGQPSQPMRANAGGAVQRPVARMEQFEDFDLIPFYGASGLDAAEGLNLALAEELAGLIDLCLETYGFVILEAKELLDPGTLEDLMDLVDHSIVVLQNAALSEDDLADWCDWASESGAGLVLDQTLS
nr:GNVR domain-containing protein [uncultured Cohaesibacter sp.]